MPPREHDDHARRKHFERVFVDVAGTVTAIDGTTVTVEVDRWYTGTGEQPEVVNLTGGTDVSVALDGVEFVVGQPYLVTAVDGEVQICGVSAPATPELEALYEQWCGS